MSEKSLSEKIVSFIGGLLPIYTHGTHSSGVILARALDTGTLILPYTSPDMDDEDQNFVEVWWQGNPYSSTIVDGNGMVSIAIVAYVDFLVKAGSVPESDRRIEVSEMSRHYGVKTGEDVHLDLSEIERPSSGGMLSLVKNGLGPLATTVLSALVGKVV